VNDLAGQWKMNANIEHRTSNIEHRILNIEHQTEIRKLNDSKYDLEERLLGYSANIVHLIEQFSNTRAGNHVAGQLLRSGTSALPNHGEAQAAESSADFVHKMKLCLKELRESHRWLLLARRVPLTDRADEMTALINETDELIRIFVKSLQTAQK